MAERDKGRLLLALTDIEPPQQLWQAALERLIDSDLELVAVFIVDDRWHRAARLPFTREVSALTGARADFTIQRARQVARDAAERARQRIAQLAAEARLKHGFTVLSGAGEEVRSLIGQHRSTLIAPYALRGTRLHETFKQLRCEIILVGDGD